MDLGYSLLLVVAVPFLLALAWATVLAIAARASIENRNPPVELPSPPCHRGGIAILGIVVPLACEAADVALFSGQFPAGRIGGGWFCAFHGMIALEVFALGTWLLLRERLGLSAGFFAGAFLSGALFAAILGLGLLPFTIAGTLAAGLGLLGLCPFLTAWAFRSAFKAAWHDAKTGAPLRFAAFSLVAGALLALLLPFAIQVGVQSADRAGFFGPGGVDACFQQALWRVVPWVGRFTHDF